VNELANYGILGIILIVFAIWYAKKDRDHKQEREMWRQTIERQFERQNETNEKVINSNNQNFNLLNSLKTLIETLGKK
jgi:hypothetical protein